MRELRLTLVPGLLGVACLTIGQPQHIAHGQLQVGGVTDGYFVANSFAPQDKQLSVSGQGTVRSTGEMAFGFNTITSRLSNSGPTTMLIAGTSNRWSDRIIVVAPGLAGQEGWIKARIKFAGQAEFDYSGIYATQPAAEVSGFWNGLLMASYDGGGGWFETGAAGSWARSGSNLAEMVYSGPTFNGTHEMMIPFTYGQEFLMGFWLEGAAIAENPSLATGSITALVDLKAEWQGITAVYDTNLVEVTNANLTSQSGTNYFQPVPEPSTIAAICFGVLALRRRKRSR